MATYNGERKGLYLSHESAKNSVRIKGDRYFLDFLDYNNKGSGAGYHSSVFTLVDEDGDKSQAIKFCNYPIEIVNEDIRAVNPLRQTLVDRFRHEIEALAIIRDSKYRDKAIKLNSYGILKFKDHRNSGDSHQLLWFSSELAEQNLADFLSQNRLSLDQKISIIYDLLSSLIGLHSLGIIHRDIKPANIVFVDGYWKFLDLGLSDSDDRELGLDLSGEKIGPFGYMSPEALNKHMGIKDEPTFAACCKIDKYSDVFQLGMLFWYILRGEVPAGIMLEKDLEGIGIDKQFFNDGLFYMLQLRKERRRSCEELLTSLSPIFRTYGI